MLQGNQWSNYRKISKGPMQLRSRRSGKEAQSAEGVGSGSCLEPLAFLGMLNKGVIWARRLLGAKK